MSENFKYGKIITSDNVEIGILNFVETEFLDERKIGVFELENDCYFLEITNTKEPGRVSQQLYLTKESFYGLFVVINLYFNQKGIDFAEKIEEVLKVDNVNFKSSLI